MSPGPDRPAAQSVISPRRTPRRTASVRLDAPSFAETDADVELRGVLADGERVRDLSIGEAVGQELQHLALARRERFSRLLVGRRGRPVVPRRQQPGSHGRGENREAPRRRRRRRAEIRRGRIARDDRPAPEREPPEDPSGAVVVGHGDDGASSQLGERVGAHEEPRGVGDDHDVDLGRRVLERGSHADHRDVRAVQARAQPETEGRGRRRDEGADHGVAPSQRPTTSLGIATERSPPITIAFRPMTSPRASRSGPPEFPGASCTSERMYERAAP